MWTSRIETLEPGRVCQIVPLQGGEAVACAEVVARWRSDGSFRAWFTGLLADAPFDAYFWEVPPMNRATIGRPFAFVLVDAPALSTPPPEAEAFAGHFGPSDLVTTFPNLGGDALLVAPTPKGALAAYCHLAAFVRGAPDEQQHALWQAVGAAVAERLSPAPLWLSTSGLGVAWLHVRLDERPKYYTHLPYRAPPE